MIKYGVFFKGRNTCVVCDANNREEAIRKARAKKVAGSDQPVVACRALKAKALRDAIKGRWVRIRANQGMDEQPDTSKGSYKSSKGSYKYRPQLKPKKN